MEGNDEEWAVVALGSKRRARTANRQKLVRIGMFFRGINLF